MGHLHVGTDRGLPTATLVEAVYSEAGAGQMSQKDRKFKKSVCDKVKITSQSVERRPNESVFSNFLPLLSGFSDVIKGQITRYQNLKMGPKKKLSDRAKLSQRKQLPSARVLALVFVLLTTNP